MRVEVLYFEGCPTYRTAESILRAVLAREDLQADVELVAVNTYEAANHFALRSRLCVKAVQAAFKELQALQLAGDGPMSV